jgi:hypothetical protein
MNSAARTQGLPPPMKLLPFHWPDCRVQGASEAERRDLLAAERAEFRQLGDQRARDDRSDAWHRDEQIFLRAPPFGGLRRRAAHRIVNALIERRELLDPAP